MPDEPIAVAETTVEPSQPAAGEPTAQAESSTPDASTPAEPAAPAKTAKQRLDEFLQADKEAAAENDKRRDRLAQRRLSRVQKQEVVQLGDTAIANEDGYQALEVIKKAKPFLEAPDESDEPDNDPPQHLRPETIQQVHRVSADVIALMGKDKDFEAGYVAIWNHHGKDVMDERIRSDPAGFIHWVNREIGKAEGLAEGKKASAGMAEARAEELAAERLRNLPTPLTGGPTGAGLPSLESWESMSPTERQRFRKDRPGEYNQMAARWTQ